MSNRSEPIRDFHFHLEHLGIFYDDQPKSGLERIVGPDGNELAVLHRFDSPVEGIASFAEIVVEMDKVLITGHDIANAGSPFPAKYHTFEVAWQQGRKLHHSPAYYGESARWRVYHCDRQDEAISSGMRYQPWLFFDLVGGGPKTKVRFEEGSLAAWLISVSRRQSRSPWERKLDRRLLRFLYDADPGTVRGVVDLLCREYPVLRSCLRELLPNHFDWEPMEMLRTITALSVDMTNLGMRASPTSIRSFFKKLGVRPLGRREPYVYSVEHCELFSDYWSARKAGVGTNDAIDEARRQLCVLDERLRQPTELHVQLSENYFVPLIAYHIDLFAKY